MSESTSSWMSRHPSLVTGVVVFLLTGATAFGIALYFIKQEQKKTEAARAEAVRARDLAIKNKRLAEAQSRIALDTTRAVVFDFVEKLREVPKAGELRKHWLQETFDKLKKLGSSIDGIGSPNQTKLVAHLELGDLLQELVDPPQGERNKKPTELTASEKNWLGEAHWHYQQAETIARTLVKYHQDGGRAQQSLARALEKLGDVSLRLGNAQDAERHYQESKQLLERYQIKGDDLQRVLKKLQSLKK